MHAIAEDEASIHDGGGADGGQLERWGAFGPNDAFFGRRIERQGMEGRAVKGPQGRRIEEFIAGRKGSGEMFRSFVNPLDLGLLRTGVIGGERCGGGLSQAEG